MREDKIKGGVSVTFDHLGELIEYLKTQPETQLTRHLSPEENTYQVVHPKLLKFDNYVRSYDEAIDLATKGWHLGAKRIGNYESRVVPLVNELMEKEAMLLDIEGEEVDVANYVIGDPEHMWRPHLEQVRDKHNVIAVDIGTSCEACSRRAHDEHPTPPQFIAARGALVALMIRYLTLQGKPPTVVVGCVGTGYLDRRIETNMVLHRPGWSLSLPRLAFVLMHTGMTMRLLFKAFAMIDASTGKKFTGNAGHRYRSGDLYGRDFTVGTQVLDANPLNISSFTGFDTDVVIPNYLVRNDDKQADNFRGLTDDLGSNIEWFINAMAKVGVHIGT